MNLVCFLALMLIRYREVLENILEEGPLLDLVAALIVVLMAIGPEIVKLGTGRTNVIVVEKEVT